MKYWAASLGAWLALSLGCCTNRVVDSWPRNACLVFDRVPSATDPQQFAGRPAWLTTTPPDVASYYREVLYDRQGDPFSRRDYVTRRAIAVRGGRGYR